MDSEEQLHFQNAYDRSYFAIIKREVHAFALKSGITQKRCAELDIVVAEILSNLSKHAQRGELFVKNIVESGQHGIEIISTDQGPGMADVQRVMNDGISTTNTLGGGLGAIKRLTNSLQLYSTKGWGTILYCSIFNKTLSSVKNPVNIKSLIVAKPNEVVCGDGFYYKVTKDCVKLFLGDGLGHGQEAHISAMAAIEAFKRCSSDSPQENIRFMHANVKKTRGLVGTVVILNRKTLTWSMCGVGNIQTKFQTGIASKSYMGYNGIIGMNIPGTLHDQEYKYEKGQTLIMCSDGIKTKWDIGTYPSILRYDLAILGAALYKDLARGTDDISIVTCKIDI
jgi:anti-sigma regulatory factor (Ser/Thr protein kinase)